MPMIYNVIIIKLFHYELDHTKMPAYITQGKILWMYRVTDAST